MGFISILSCSLKSVAYELEAQSQTQLSSFSYCTITKIIRLHSLKYSLLRYKERTEVLYQKLYSLKSLKYLASNRNALPALA